jgi:uncharacterized protein YgiM (DUF1202 family)
MITVCAGQATLRYGEKVVTVVAAEKVNVRAQPELRPDTVIGQVAGGTQLRLLETAKDWFKVSLPDGEIGWLFANYGREDVARDLVEVKVAIARVRAAIGQGSQVITKVQQGIRLHPLAVEDSWVKVRLPDDQEGWIRGDLVSVNRVSRGEEESLEESSTQTLLLLASVGSGVSAFSFVLVLTTVFRRRRQAAARADQYCY